MKTRQVACHLRTSPLRHSKRLPYGVCKNANANYATLLFLFPQNLDIQSFAGALKIKCFAFRFSPYHGGLIMDRLLISFSRFLFICSAQRRQIALKCYVVALLASPYSTSTKTYSTIFALHLLEKKRTQRKQPHAKRCLFSLTQNNR